MWEMLNILVFVCIVLCLVLIFVYCTGIFYLENFIILVLSLVFKLYRGVWERDCVLDFVDLVIGIFLICNKFYWFYDILGII